MSSNYYKPTYTIQASVLSIQVKTTAAGSPYWDISLNRLNSGLKFPETIKAWDEEKLDGLTSGGELQSLVVSQDKLKPGKTGEWFTDYYWSLVGPAPAEGESPPPWDALASAPLTPDATTAPPATQTTPGGPSAPAWRSEQGRQPDIVQTGIRRSVALKEANLFFLSAGAQQEAIDPIAIISLAAMFEYYLGTGQVPPPDYDPARDLEASDAPPA